MTLTLDEAVDLTRTGDLWLFRGHSAADHAIRVVTNAPVNHVGMAVVLDDLPPLMWNAELGRGLRDVWTDSHHRGVQAHAELGVPHQGWEVVEDDRHADVVDRGVGQHPDGVVGRRASAEQPQVAGAGEVDRLVQGQIRHGRTPP